MPNSRPRFWLEILALTGVTHGLNRFVFASIRCGFTHHPVRVIALSGSHWLRSKSYDHRLVCMHIFILGHANDEQGRLSSSSKSRIAYAVSVRQQLRSKNIPVSLLATGGFGSKFNSTATPHHEWVEREIRKQGFESGVQSGACLSSANTVEDAVLIHKYCNANDVGSLQIVTNDFHQERCQLVFGAIFNSQDIPVIGVDDPPDVAQSTYDHETRATKHLKNQGGVLWGDKLFPFVGGARSA